MPLVFLLVLVVLVAACGGSDEAPSGDAALVGEAETETAPEGAALPAWVEERLAAKSGPDVAVVRGTSDHAVGANRISFLVVRGNGAVVRSPQARVLVAPEGDAKPVETTATLVPLGSHSHPEGATEGHAEPDATELYVANVKLPEPGRYWFVAEPAGEAIQAIGTIDAREQTNTPPIGGKAIPSDNPTLADAPAEEITTARPPDTELLRHSIADSLNDGVPFVVTFATPAYCESRTCGPTVEVVDAVRKQFERSRIRFIHIEIYEDNDPKNDVNRWVKEWKLPTEPWVFLVDRRGIIRAKFEGSVSRDELERAVRTHLLR